MKMNNLHTSVLLKECIEMLDIKPNGVYVDCTAGYGGHSSEIINVLNTKGRLVCIDCDINAIDFLKEKFNKVKNIDIVHGNFSNISAILQNLKIKKINGALLDLGLSSPMLDNQERGFSYHGDSILDMRMDQSRKINAQHIINNYSSERLNEIFIKYGEIFRPYVVVKKIIETRKITPITTNKQLVDIIKSTLSFQELKKQKHPARQYFQAIRIAVNNELDNLTLFLNRIKPFLAKNSIVAIISFHSLEDRIVKHTFRE
jgi:16S rRNA (cytosine1402-N4)-methyltransferase